jgi:uncharacterized protein (TIGR02996 family)
MVEKELLDAVVREPEVVAHWMIYADTLLEAGDPRGELISLDLAIDDSRVMREDVQWRIDQIQSEERALLSERLASQAHFWQFSFWRGFIGIDDGGA